MKVLVHGRIHYTKWTDATSTDRYGCEIIAEKVDFLTISRGRFEQRIREMAAGNPMLEAATGPMLNGRSALRRELAGLERHVRLLAQEDSVCRRLMSMPGIGAVVALTCRSAVDDPDRFTSSKKVGPWVGLTPPRNRSGERDISGGITKAGDVNFDARCVRLPRS